jgi:sugar lactone lactonase YvrE
LFAVAAVAVATETENLNLQVLPALGKVVIDGQVDDWDLSGGTLACGDVENQRDQYGIWIHTMWDADNLYILARWMDLTPLNHPGSIKGDYGFNGDCLQVRVLTAPAEKLEKAATRGSPQQDSGPDHPGARTSHITAWRDRDGLDTVKIDWGQKFNEGSVEAKEKGGRQAFKVWDDKRGYTQELSIPWTLLSRDGWKPEAGARMAMTFEPNFLTRAGSRLTIKDIFRPETGIDRVFTFQAPNCWGFATLEAKGQAALRPVRLSDGREFPVRLAAGLPTVDWTGLVKSRAPEGFKPITFAVEEDGYVSLNLFRADGTVARQLLAAAFYTKGTHEVRWDGLGTMSVRVPGKPLEPGEYTWGGLWQPGVSLTLRGWCGSSSATPWGNVWGADHGDPCAAAADDERVYLGWGGGEGAKPLLACNPNGDILWKQIRGGIASASLVAAAEGTVYVWNEVGQYAPRSLYRVDAKTGGYTTWEASGSTDLSLREVFTGDTNAPNSPGSLCAGKGMVFLGFGGLGKVAVVDAKTGKTLRMLDVPKVGDIELGPDGWLYAVSYNEKGCHIVAVDPQNGKTRTVGQVPLQGKDWVRALAVDKDGELYCGITGERHYVQVLDKTGKVTRTIGVKEGRRLNGPWQQEGMFQVSALAVDGKGQLWVTEQDGQPRRVSVWDPKSGAFLKEFFGSATYGAIGGGINPVDPNLMVGQGCEWRIDPATGRATCLGTIDRNGMMASRFGFSPDGRLFLAVTPGFLHGRFPIRFFEKTKGGAWKLRSMLAPLEQDKVKLVKAWADENDDGQEQPGEVKTYPDDLGAWIQGWYMAVNPDLSCYGGAKQIKVTGWTKCGAPVYDLSKAIPMPKPNGGRGGMGAQWNAGSADGRFVLWNGSYGDDHSTFDCYDIASGKLMWTYPNNFTGVHGSHRACPPEVGLIRGAYDICGSVKLPEPIGNIWVIPTNKGEWHALTEKGYYLTKFWEGDPMRVEFPDKAMPGADCTRCPPGAGEEAFGGSICLGTNGEFSLQGGHTSFWNVQVNGLDKARALAGGKLTLSPADVEQAQTFRQRYLKAQEGDRAFVVTKTTPAFSGDLVKDFGVKAVKAFARQDNAKVKIALAWDEQNLYAAWQVMDDTPWVNGADAPEFLYARGDTVDLQLGLNPKAGDREKAEVGDLRLSIGPFQTQPTAVIYRRVVDKGAEKKAMKFVSGVYRDGVWMESVTYPKDIKVSVKLAGDKKGYVVEAAIPWTALGAKPEAGLKLTGDLGVTHGNKAGNDTVLRSYWSNLSTGLVSDEVEELMMTPRAWGAIELQ